ncbi:hypothetical protein [Paracoccus shanxieyensis]|uniref:hypothetical protein n=1 Tax=Paracoccus shanxieyensis TaxID=2675752 RepID=UPI001E2D9B3F|nr:hypothetical protein [Paracoccus shanxieyensis]
MRALSGLFLVAVITGLSGPAMAQDIATQPVSEAVPEAAGAAAPAAPDVAQVAPADAATAGAETADAATPAESAPLLDLAMPDEPAPATQPQQDAQATPSRAEKVWTCESSIAGTRTEIGYVRDDEFRANVGRVEKNFSGWGKISCPGYVTLREILRRNAMTDDGSYCLLWDSQNDTYIGAQQGPRKGNAVCRKTFCERVNSTRAATFRNANAMAVSGFDAITQRPGAAVLAATSGSVVGTLEAAGAAAVGVAASPVAVGSMVIGSAAVGGTMWYCSEG